MNKDNKTFWYAFLFFVFLGPSLLFAQSEYYSPKALVVPLHDQKNQLHVSAGWCGGYDLNLSYAFTQNLALFHTATLDIGTRNRTTILGGRYNIQKNDYILNAGLGYFSKLDKPRSYIIEAYLGAGLSRINNFEYVDGKIESARFTHAGYWTGFGQFNIGKKRLKSEYALGLRLAYIQYMNIDFYGIHPNVMHTKSRYVDLSGVTAEPGFSYSYKLKWVKLNAQAGFTTSVADKWIERVNTSTYNDETWTSINDVQVGFFSFFGRLSLQHNFNFGKENRRAAHAMQGM